MLGLVAPRPDIFLNKGEGAREIRKRTFLCSIFPFRRCSDCDQRLDSSSVQLSYRSKESAQFCIFIPAEIRFAKSTVGRLDYLLSIS